MPSKLNAIDGLFLTFTEEERSRITDTLQRDGYSDDADGLKAWILAISNEPPEPTSPRKPIDTILERMEQYLYDHPEEVSRFGGAISQKAGRFMQAILQGTLK